MLTFRQSKEGIAEHYLFDEFDTWRFRIIAKVASLLKRIWKRLFKKQAYYREFRLRHTEGREKGHNMINFTISEYRLELHPLVREADIIHLHWVCGGILDFERFFLKVPKKIVWTLHDMNPFTGGCHYANDCDLYMTDCHKCPQLKGTIDSAITGKMLSANMSVLARRKEVLSIVTPSSWLMHCSQKSALFKQYQHQHIFNVVAGDQFYPVDKIKSRERLGIPLNKRVVLCVASFSDPRKGNMLLLEAMEIMLTENVLLCSVGSVSDDVSHRSDVLQLGYIHDSHVMRDVYNAVDVFALPSMADNFPNTVVESLRCGTPVVAFDVGGIPEQITESNGVLVEQRDARSLAAGLDHFFENAASYDQGKISSEAMARYSVDAVLNKHMELYKSLAG